MGDARKDGSFSKGKTWPKSHHGRFEQLLDTGFLSDLEICVGEKVFHAHKVIVATGSRILYEKVCKTESEKYVVQEDSDPVIFHAFLKFLYTGLTHDLKIEHALPLLKLAVSYQVADLEEKCRSMLNEDLTDETAIQIYQQAAHFRDDDLMEKALRYICRNAWSIVESNEFTNLTIENLTRLLRSEKLLVLNETQLVRGLFSWAKKECGRRKEKMSVERLVVELSRWICWDRIDLDKYEGSDSIQLTKLYNDYHMMRDGDILTPKRQCKFTRKYFEDDDSSYLISRFPQKFAYCTDNRNANPEIVKFKTDITICLLSIGIPAYSQTCQDFHNVQLEIWEEDDTKSGCGGDNGKIFISEKVPHSKKMHHLVIRKPYKIRKDTWYCVSGTITGTPGYGNMGGKSVHHVKCSYPNGRETNVKFEFKSGGGGPEDIGQIDEFCFKLVEN